MASVVSTYLAIRATRASGGGEGGGERCVGDGLRGGEASGGTRAGGDRQAVNDFLQQDLLGQADVDNQARPGQTPDPDIKVRTLLDRASEKIGGRFDQQPRVEAAIRRTIGDTYVALGLYRWRKRIWSNPSQWLE